MTQDIRPFLLWCLCLNYAVLILWFAAFVLAHEWMYGLHARWFKLSVETFDAVHYAGMAAYKIGILLFVLVPWLALTLSS